MVYETLQFCSIGEAWWWCCLGGQAVGVMLTKVPVIAEEERTPLVCLLLELIRERDECIQELKDHIAILKGEKPRPKIAPSRLEKGQEGPESGSPNPGNEKRPGSEKRSKTAELEIHKTLIVQAECVPEGSRFKGYNDFVVQDLVITPHNIRYRVERWLTPEGHHVTGKLPVSLNGGHFGPTLISYILYQHHHNMVTQPLILEELREWGFDISSGQIDRILTEGKDLFHAEKDEILRSGLEVSSYVNVDDTGARHAGKNGYCTHIGNDLFAWFQSSEHKNRINFLELLRAGHNDYVVDDDALAYMRTQGLPKVPLALLTTHENKEFEDKEKWEAHLSSLGISTPRHVTIATEGALIGSILSHGVSKELAIVSDDAGQFDVLLHALCWIHAERTINKIVPHNDEQRVALEEIRSQIWQFYADLKAYKDAPDEAKKAELEQRFDAIFTTKTCFVFLNQALKRLHNNKAELLLVLERPDLPLHNNLSEGDIREYVKKRKISGGTRSPAGKRCRDTFASLKKTCRKHGISFWSYLLDRVSKLNHIPSLSQIIIERANAP